MESRLFNRPKDLRFVRPHRVALLEWLRAVRHNLFCEITLLLDRLHHKVKEFHFARPDFHFSAAELFPESSREAWLTRLRHLINGRRAAEAVLQSWELLRTRGIKQTFWPLLFMIGLVIGFGVKSWAEDHLTIGYKDYKLSSASALYDLNALKIKVQTEQGTVVENTKKIYPACNLE